MIDVRAFERQVAEAGERGMHLTREALLDIVNELRLGNVSRLMRRTDADMAAVTELIYHGGVA